MSRFHIGQDVYIAMDDPANIADVEARKYCCTIGSITDGPFAPHTQPTLYHGYTNPHPSWDVAVDGVIVNVAEHLLSPFEPPAREVDIGQWLELTE